MPPITCPGCGAPIGPPTTTDIYKHAVQCFHLPHSGLDELLAVYGDKEDERSRRIAEVLRAAKARR